MHDNAELVGDARRLGVEAILAARRDDEIGALSRQPFRHRQSDADAATGNHRDLVTQPEIHVFLHLARCAGAL